MGMQNLQCVATAAVRDATNGGDFIAAAAAAGLDIRLLSGLEEAEAAGCGVLSAIPDAHGIAVDLGGGSLELAERSEEHTSELQSLMRISYAVFCLNKKK